MLRQGRAIGDIKPAVEMSAGLQLSSHLPTASYPGGGALLFSATTMTDPPSRISELEQLLRDERALRMRAELRATEQAAKADTWRTRADERAARIEKLTTETGRSKRRRQKRSTPDTSEPAPQPVERPHRPATARLAAVRVATALEPCHDILTAAFATTPVASTPASLTEADLVIADAVTLASLSADDRTRFASWLDAPARQPLLLIDDGNLPDDDLVEQATAVLAIREHAATAGMAHILDPVFDPRIDNPMGWHAPRLERPIRERRDGLTIVADGDAVVAIESFDGTAHQPPWAIRAMARGVPTTPDRLDLGDATALARAATAARRWAFRNHTPMRRGLQLLELAGVPVRDPAPTAAAILVSIRPDEAARAVSLLAAQSYRPMSIVIGLHGQSPTPALQRAIGLVPPDIPVTTLEIPGDVTLGEALNRAIATTGAEILAKIDDDDFYGPCHIEDGIHALDYSGASVVGKGSQFTYVEEEDATVLRRRREEETLLGGSPTGATMIFRRSTWEAIGFPHRPRQVDVLFTAAARRNGADVYAGSRWEFCYVRKATGHTWSADASTFTSGSDPAWRGFHPELTVVTSLPDPGHRP